MPTGNCFYGGRRYLDAETTHTLCTTRDEAAAAAAAAAAVLLRQMLCLLQPVELIIVSDD